MTTEDQVTTTIVEAPAAMPQNETPVPAENQEQAPAEGEKPDAAKDTAKEDADASEAARKLNERKQQKAERYRDMDRRMHEAERRATAAEARVKVLEAAQKPDPAKFTDPAEYDMAQATFAAQQLRKADLEIEAKEAQSESIRVRQEAYSEALDAYRAENPDFDPTAFIEAARVGRHAEDLAAAIMEDPDTGLQIMAALSKSPGEVRRIANLPPRQQLRELTRIEVNLSQPVVQKVTQAPAPVTAVSGKSAKPTVRPEDMSIDDWMRMENERVRKLRGR